MLNWRDPRNPLAGGAERVSMAFMRGLVERGHQVDWFTFAFPGAAPEETLDGVRVRRAGGVFSSMLAARRWYRRQPRANLVIDQHHGIPWFAPWWCRTACLAYIHEVLGPVWNAFYRWPKAQIGRTQERWTHWCYRRVPFWVPSESTRTSLQRHGVREVHVLPNGVDVEPLPELPPKSIAGRLRLITVSRLAPNKRVDHAIAALAELSRRGRDAELVVVGDGIMEPALRRQAGALDLVSRVRFVGYQPEAAKQRLLQDAHVLLHPSVREGWGLNVIEANAMGTPAAVYPVDGLVDSTVDGVTGRVAGAETPAALADAVEWVVDGEDRFATVRRAAWRRSAEFRWEPVIERVCGFLEGRMKAVGIDQKMV